jgi:hypothetical protein
VLTSQRIVDVVLKAFHACAASQGCTKYVFSILPRSSFPLLRMLMFWDPSNLTFGAGGKDKDGMNVVGWGYYEVRPLTLLFFSQRKLPLRRQLQAVPVLALPGTEHQVSTRT